MKGIVVAGTHSGVGKTTVAIGIMAHLRQKGYRVQPFKVGPDYIDPTYHKAACGVASRNLDLWLLKESALLALFERAMRGKEIAVIEGVMGLYDGVRGEDEAGSTAQVAKFLGLPVVLVVDAAAAARSVGASALGFKNFDRGLNLAGVILNGVAGEKHLDFIKPSLQKAGVRLIGYLPRSPDLTLPERHLGLVPTVESDVSADYLGRLAEKIEASVDAESLLKIASPIARPSRQRFGLFPERPAEKQASIAVATDKAFGFYYPDSLDLLEAWGAELIPFSPLEDRELPRDSGAVYIGGGFPELYGRELSENSSMRASLLDAARRGLPIYAECGGLMYLGDSIEDFEGRVYPMVGLFSYRSMMKEAKLTLGYREVKALDNNPLLRAGESVRGHEFHLSELAGQSEGQAAYKVLDQSGRKEGFRFKNTLASYIHLHFGSKKTLAPSFVASCARWRATAR